MVKISILKSLYSYLEGECYYELSTPDKFLIERWYMELRSNFLKEQYRSSIDEERKLSLDEMLGYYAFGMIKDFILLYFPPTSALQEDIDHEEKRRVFIAESYMETYLKKKERN